MGVVGDAERLERVDELGGDVERGVAERGAQRGQRGEHRVALGREERAERRADARRRKVAEHEEHVRQRVALLGEARRLGERHRGRRRAPSEAAGAGGGAQ